MLFPKFANVPVEKLKYDENYRSHATSVMQAVQLAVSSIDDLDGLFSTLRDLGTVHTGLGIQDIHFLVSCSKARENIRYAKCVWRL